MSFKCIQINLNHSWSAFDLLKQQVFESAIGLVIVSEPPYNVAISNRWFASTDKLAAILWNPDSSIPNICRLVRSGDGFVAVKCDKFYILSCYISPNVSVRIFENILDSISECTRVLPGPFVIEVTSILIQLSGVPITSTEGVL